MKLSCGQVANNLFSLYSEPKFKEEGIRRKDMLQPRLGNVFVFLRFSYTGYPELWNFQK